MKVVIINRSGNSGISKIREIETPEPTSSEILVRVHATALNRADLLQRRGWYPAPPGVRQDIPGLKFTAEVLASGKRFRTSKLAGDKSRFRDRLHGESSHSQAYDHGNPGSSELRGGGVDS